MKYKIYIGPIADTYAFCLMPNHFHFLIKIKSEEELQLVRKRKKLQGIREHSEKQNLELKTKNLQGLREHSEKQNLEIKNEISFKNSKDLEGFKLSNNSKGLEDFISQQFCNLFNSYTKSFNKVYKRRGSLFIPNFKRKEVDSNRYLLKLVQYIHNNPVHHGFTKYMGEWKFSSYNDFSSENKSFIDKKEVINWFDDLNNFKYCHQQPIEAGFEMEMEFE